MSELTMDRLRENLESLKMKNTLEILDNYLERAVAENLNIVEVLDHIFSEEAKSKRKRAYEKQVQMSGFPIKKTLDDFDFSFQPSIDKRQIDELATMRFLENGENVVFLGPPGVGKTHLASALGLVAAQHRFSTYYINCHQLIEQLKKAHFENRLPDKLKILAKYRMLIIDEIGYLPMDIQGANLFFQLIARRYEKTSTVFTSNKTFSQWNEVFADVTIASAILGPFAMLFPLNGEMDPASLSVGAGMGTSGLVGPLNFLSSSSYSYVMILCLVFVCVVAPTFLVFLFDWLFRRFHLIEKGDFSLSNDLN